MAFYAGYESANLLCNFHGDPVGIPADRLYSRYDLFLPAKRQKQERELIRLKEEYEQEVLRSQLEIQESTMKTIAQELHDNIGQSLSVIKLWMSMAPIEPAHEAYEGVQNSKEMLHKVIRDMADLTKSLHTDRITDIGLSEAINFDLASIRRAGT